MGKELRETLQSMSVFNSDIEELHNKGFLINKEEKQFNVKVIVQSYMMDTKAANLYLGVGSEYCDLCTCSKGQSLDIEKIENGFVINCDITMNEILNQLEQEDGSLLKKKNDYTTRGRKTGKPIPTSDPKPTNCSVVIVFILFCILDF